MSLTNQDYHKLIDNVISWSQKEDPKNIKQWEYYLDEYLIRFDWNEEERKQFIAMGSESILSEFFGVKTDILDFYGDVFYCSDRMSLDRLFRLHFQYRTIIK